MIYRYSRRVSVMLLLSLLVLAVIAIITGRLRFVIYVPPFRIV